MVHVNPQKELKCAKCQVVFYDNKDLLRNAGTTREGKTYYNTECPNCGAYDRMSEDYLGVPDNILEKYSNEEINYQKLEDKKTDEQLKKDKERAKHHSNF